MAGGQLAVSVVRDTLPGTVRIRSAGKVDLVAINRVIEAAVMSWQLPERVRRLALPVYRYTEVDLVYLDAVVAEDRGGRLAGVATWEGARGGDLPDGVDALLLHGLYVVPDCHCQGIGRRLFQAAESAVGAQGRDGLLVRAQADAGGFFLAMGMQPIEVRSPGAHYAHRFWKAAPHCRSTADPDQPATAVRPASPPA
jgi:GNAT superfamily N-acetyltransferase